MWIANQGAARMAALGQRLALDQLKIDVLAGGAFLLDLFLPGAVGVRPGFDGITIASNAFERQACIPAVEPGLDLGHRYLAPRPMVFGAEFEDGGDLAMSLAEDVGPHGQGIAD